jgi:methyl-accepting chemotaxis protein
MSRGYKRRNIFIKKELQGRFIFKSFLLSFFGVVAFALIFSLLSRDNLTITYDGQHLQLGKTPLVLFQNLLAAQWVFLVTIGVLVTVFAMLWTHRLAGPLFRFEKTLAGMLLRNLDQKIVLRHKDEAKETAELFNNVTQLLSEDIASLKHSSEHLGVCLQRLQIGTEDQSDLLRQAVEEQRKITQLLGEYRLRSG